MSPPWDKYNRESKASSAPVEERAKLPWKRDQPPQASFDCRHCKVSHTEKLFLEITEESVTEINIREYLLRRGSFQAEDGRGLLKLAPLLKERAASNRRIRNPVHSISWPLVHCP